MAAGRQVSMGGTKEGGLAGDLASFAISYGIAILHLDVPDVIVGARLGSPLVVGLGRGENFLASDVAAVVAHTVFDAIQLLFVIPNALKLLEQEDTGLVAEVLSLLMPV